MAFRVLVVLGAPQIVLMQVYQTMAFTLYFRTKLLKQEASCTILESYSSNLCLMFITNLLCDTYFPLYLECSAFMAGNSCLH